MAAVSYDPNGVCEIEVRDLEYQRGMLVRVYRPKGPGPFPAMLDIHGGVWSIGDRTASEVMDQAVAESGVVVAALDFRLAPDHAYPAQVQDINLGIRWLKSRAADFGGVPETVGVFGCSSGGHSAFLCGMRPGHPEYAALDLAGSQVDATVKYVVAGWPIVDPFARYQYAQEGGKDRLVELSEGYFLTTDAMKEGNPFQMLRRGEKVELPPALIIQGTADENLPVLVTEEFVTAYKAAGGDIDLEMFPGMPHAFGVQPGPETDRAVALMKQFIAQVL
ncbi:MAG TPA: hypothetical protein DHW65_01550 [Dehalococcoidia bacterium]|nr:hypothetical protein [Chloroflexota bacterium]MQF96417.1 alpha/beta hydrolase [SAR202 cluster bacterium]HAA95960.1 hypothetical protein [Dehalococcoidia bacterium]HCL25018.1 hypothetical protein [Dehalococcoidia bacterium]